MFYLEYYLQLYLSRSTKLITYWLNVCGDFLLILDGKNSVTLNQNSCAIHLTIYIFETKFCSFEKKCDGEVDGRNAYHGGVNCIMTSPPGGIVEDDLQCTASDELDSVIDILDDDERPISSLISITSTKCSLHSEVNALKHLM